MSAIERTGWRDEAISARHRLWGYNCPAVDLDFLMSEYNHGKTVAIIEYKHKFAQVLNFKHPSYQVLTDLANNYGPGALPFAVVFYCPQAWWFRIVPLNEAAALHWPEGWRDLSEQDFVSSLYALRMNNLSQSDQSVIDGLNTATPPKALVAVA